MASTQEYNCLVMMPTSPFHLKRINVVMTRQFLLRRNAVISLVKIFRVPGVNWRLPESNYFIMCIAVVILSPWMNSGPTFIKPDQLDPWIKDQMKITLLSTFSPLQLPNFVSCGRDKPSHMTQNLVTVGTKLWTAERFLVDPWSMDQADLVW